MIECPICKSNKTYTFLNKKDIPVYQNFIFREMDKAINSIRGNLSLAICKECEFIFNYDFEVDKVQYNEIYDNTQTCSPKFQKYIDGIINKLIDRYELQNKTIVEVGCGKGLFLKQITEISNGKGYGFDPSYEDEKIQLDGKLVFENKYYDKNCSEMQADLVILRHVIEHIQNPIEIIQSINEALVNSPDALLYIETPCVEWILKNNIIYDFFYEHCSYFTKKSLKNLLEIADFEILEMDHTFEGQYIYAIAKVKNICKDSLFDMAIKYAENVENKKHKWNKNLLNYNGNIAVWGAGAKGVTFLNDMDPNCKFINCIIDINENKQNNFIPGTGHKIVSYTEIRKRNIKTIIVMNWNYIDEIKLLLDKIDIDIILINGEDDIH